MEAGVPVRLGFGVLRLEVVLVSFYVYYHEVWTYRIGIEHERGS